MKKQSLLKINAKYETNRIVKFLNSLFLRTEKENVVMGWSGGIDSTVCLYLLTRAINPKQIYVYHLPYDKSYWKELIVIAKKLTIPETNIREIIIKKSVNQLKITLNTEEKNRIGNIMARVRMVVLFDQAKFRNALVCGTENKTEHLLGYFTRFGDAASDIEPIAHLFKTQIYQLATFLRIEEVIQKRIPTADLWEGQTDEGDFGFTYKEADQVLFRFINKSKQKKQNEKKGSWNTKKIIERYKENKFKQEVPYMLD